MVQQILQILIGKGLFDVRAPASFILETCTLEEKCAKSTQNQRGGERKSCPTNHPWSVWLQRYHCSCGASPPCPALAGGAEGSRTLVHTGLRVKICPSVVPAKMLCPPQPSSAFPRALPPQALTGITQLRVVSGQCPGSQWDFGHGSVYPHHLGMASECGNLKHCLKARCGAQEWICLGSWGRLNPLVSHRAAWGGTWDIRQS